MLLALQTVVVDCRGHMLGRLASILAKQLLSGQHVVSRAWLLGNLFWSDSDDWISEAELLAISMQQARRCLNVVNYSRV